MANLGLSGLASGVDTASIVSQLMALERQSVTRTGYRQQATAAKATGLEAIKAKLEALKTAATALSDGSTWGEGQTLVSSDPARVAAARTGGAPIGTYGVRVQQLSAAAQKTYTWTVPADATTLTLDDANGSTPAVTLNIAKGATIADVASAINAKSDAPVYAAVVNGSKLVLSSRATGAAADFTVAGDSLSAVQKTYSWTPSAGATTIELDDADGGTAPLSIAIGANATIADVAQAINDANGAASAEVVNGKLVLSGRANGAAGEFSLAGGAGQLVATHPIAGKDALYKLDGDDTVYSSPTNTVQDAIPGVTLTLKGTTTDSVSITAGTPALDQDAIKAKVRAFVSAYNAVVDIVREDVAEKKFSGSVSSAIQAAQGALYGDTGLISMQSRLRQAVSQGYTDVGNADTLDDLADIGISSGRLGATVDQAKSGTLQIDETKLAKAISENPQAVRRLMGTTEAPGLVQNIGDMVAGIAKTLDTRIATIGKESKRIGEQMTAMETRLDAKEKRLTAQFAAMEKALGAAQQQQSWLTGQLASLSTSSSS